MEGVLRIGGKVGSVMEGADLVYMFLAEESFAR
jgi:hypothetical protein